MTLGSDGDPRELPCGSWADKVPGMQIPVPGAEWNKDTAVIHRDPREQPLCAGLMGEETSSLGTDGWQGHTRNQQGPGTPPGTPTGTQGDPQSSKPQIPA